MHQFKQQSHYLAALLLAVFLPLAALADRAAEATDTATINQDKLVIYQVFTRLFGNKNTINKPWGSKAENGVGKFSDINAAALRGIAELGVTHIWYTGVPHHALIGDYSSYSISGDDPDVVKGRAGSPYAVKDYYNVNPDLADDPARRLQEFQALIQRSHRHGMKVLIDIVPNHVARGYHSISRPPGVEDFGAGDDTTVSWRRDNNFYYVVGAPFQVPKSAEGYQPLGGEAHPLADGQFTEFPAKWTGNGARAAQPNHDDWYETVKINFGVSPAGDYAFPRLPQHYRELGAHRHRQFWNGKAVPDSWKKFEHIVHYWLQLGVDGFRYDMAELVPVEFWSYLNSSIKAVRPDALLLAEVYQPQLYRDYIQLGKMDYLYDKVGFYDTLKIIMQGKGSTDLLVPVQASVANIEAHMLHFLENHDEHRIASPDFLGDADLARPGMVVSATISRSPTLIYFGQEVGEPGAGDAGFGKAGRTTIFDYWGVPAQQRWMNSGRFDGGALSNKEKSLRQFYRRLLNLSRYNPSMQGHYREIHSINREHGDNYGERLFSFARWSETEQLIIVSNFDRQRCYPLKMLLPPELVSAWQLSPGKYPLQDLLADAAATELVVTADSASFQLKMQPLQSVILRLMR